MAGQQIVVLGTYAPSLTGFRGDLIAAMIARGHRVTACAPDASPATVDKLRRLGADYRHVPFARNTLGPLADLATLKTLVRLFKNLRPQLVVAYTIKAVIYGSIAARLAGVPRAASMITGLGFAFGDGNEPRRRLTRGIAKRLYRTALAQNCRIFFQNPDDQSLFVDLGLVRDPALTVLINGSGVDLEGFAPAPPVLAPSFLLAARLISEKGVRDYAAAARLLRARHPESRCRLAGWLDGTANSVRQDELLAWGQEGAIDYLGPLQDIRPALADCAVYVLPSYYREGTPRSVLEAMAMGRPIITTDMPGCRETVEDGVNGFLVPPRDPPALAAAMARFADSPDLIASMGAASRARAEARYDVHGVNRTILDALDL